MEDPPAAHVPARVHDTELTAAFPPAFRAPEPGTSIAFSHTPFFSLTTNGWTGRARPVYYPPAAQLPAEAHDTKYPEPMLLTARIATGRFRDGLILTPAGHAMASPDRDQHAPAT